MNITWNETLDNLCKDYIDHIKSKIATTDCLTDDVRHLIEDFFHYIDTDYANDQFQNHIEDYAAAHGIEDTALLFDGELKELPIFLMGEEWTKAWCQYVKAEAESPYTAGYSRRSVRSRKMCLHSGNIVAALKNFFILKASGFTTLEIMQGGRDMQEIKDIAHSLERTAWLTGMINIGDNECIDYLKEAMVSENNANRLSYDFFRAIAQSGNKELLKLEGKLLLAARLQEGLRQAIVETMDEGVTESYIYLLDIILRNNLQRFAAVKRGLAVTTGLDEAEAPDRINDKFINLVSTYLTDREAAKIAIASKDAMEVYLALWSIAFFNVEDLESPIKSLIATAPAYQVEAAVLVLSTLQYPELCRKIISDVIHTRSSDHGILAGALPLYLTTPNFYISWYGEPGSVPALTDFFSSREEAVNDFQILIDLLDNMKETEIFDPYVFPWNAAKLTKGDVAMKLTKIALLLDSSEYIDKALDYIKFMDTYQRAGAIKYLLRRPSTRKEVEFAVIGMADRGEEPREACCAIVRRLHDEGKLKKEDYVAMEELLRLKASRMRITIIEILSSLSNGEDVAAVSRLLADKTADRRLAALDIIKIWIERSSHQDEVKKLLPELKSISRPTSKEKILIDNILESCNTTKSTYNAANGFGLYNPDDSLHIKVKCPEKFSIEKALSFKNKGSIFSFRSNNRAQEIMLKIIEIIKENADYEFKNSWGETVRLGNTPKYNRYGSGLKALAKPEMWEEFYKREINSPIDMLRLDISISNFEKYNSPFFPLFKCLLGKAFHQENTMDELKGLPYYSQAFEVCKCLIEEFGNCLETWRISTDILGVIVTTVSAHEMVHRYNDSYSRYRNEDDHSVLGVWPFSMLCSLLVNSSSICDDDLFVDSFSVRYEYYRKLGYKKCFNPVNPSEYLRLWNLGLITDNEFWHEMLGRESSPEMVGWLTERLPGVERRHKWQKQIRELTPVECDFVNTAVNRILDIELQRGDTPTVVTKLAHNIKIIKGVDYLIKILSGLGKEKPKCNIWSVGENKRDTLTWLLHVSCPSDEDTAYELKNKAEFAGISEERLVEAAMYSPRWLSLVEEAIGWPGLESAAYYFMVHTGERLDESVKSHISRYTSVAPEDFADGAFDPVWFNEVYKLLGKKRFEVVYDAAKYISEGNRHTRARKLSDASLGILKAKEVQKEIVDKRNKDLVVAYGLIPLGRNRIKDLRQRYELLNRFLKESKQFGSQRQASEGRAVKLALDNLARIAGFGDSTRLTWSMEADLIKEISEYLSPKEINGVIVYIELQDGIPSLVIENKGKRLQSIPSRLKKDSNIVKLREIYQQLKDQHVRGRSLLEEAMVNGSEFTGEEIAQLSENPIIWSLFSRLVLVNDSNIFGFPGNDGRSLVAADGEVSEILPTDHLRIAHPYDFMNTGVWSAYQTILFERQWRQPFKQVFRELYVPTSEEKEQWKSMRYAGNQIMPARTVGLLRKRQWTVDYENGLQKVCFNGDITVVLYAMADWFSPSDIEAPTLEYVAFYDRRSLKNKKIKDVKPIVFSEIMRDVDLAVSVANAGGVDPETSHSTIEMRRAIVEHAMPMFGVNNFELSGNFVKIHGSLCNYNVHLGSGVVHKEGGNQIAVLPVHTQGRGRIFLPFLDEDPKTAEIISKILLFAEDTKIKDPSILDQI